MKKRWISLALALTMAISLAVPALAADGSAYSGSFTYNLDDPNLSYGNVGVFSAYRVKTLTREEKTEGGTTYQRAAYGEPLLQWSAETAVHTLPLGTQYTWTGLRPEYSVTITIYSDIDGDGIYEEAMLDSRGNEEFKILPMDGEWFSKKEHGLDYGDHLYMLYYTAAKFPEKPGLGIQKTQDKDGTMTLTVDSASVYEAFGANTLLVWNIMKPAHEVDPEEEILGIPIGEYSGLACGTLLIPGEGGATGVVPGFLDTTEWCREEALWAALEDITNGYGAKDKFAPGVNCSQVEILTFLWRAENKPAAGSKSPFTVASYYQDAVDWAYGKGIIGGGFNPGAPCTRAQAVTYIWKARNELEAKETASFSDVDAGSPIAPAVSWAVENGVTKGYGGADTFAPDRVCSRGEIACFLYRAYN